MRKTWRRTRHSLWFMPALGGALASFAALAAVLINGVVPDTDSIPEIDQETLDSLLEVIASSMLAVTTFSLSILVAAFASASNGATPRATALVMQDRSTQTAIASFIAAFIFAVIAKVALGLGYYDAASRLVMFLATALVLIYLIVVLIRWVGALSQLGRLANTLAKAEDAARDALAEYFAQPLMGAGRACPVADDGLPVRPTSVGSVQEIDVGAIDSAAQRHGGRVHVQVRPGAFVSTASVIATVHDSDDPHALQEAVTDAFTVGRGRSYGQDPRYGLLVLSEIAQRALSPAVNDPGTAIEVLNALARLLLAPRPDPIDPPYARVAMVPLDVRDLVTEPMRPIARDGAGSIEVGIRLQSVLGAIAACHHGEISGAAREAASVARDRARRALTEPSDIAALDATYDRWHGSDAMHPATRPLGR